MTKWSLTYDRFDPDQEGLREALCPLGNGYSVTRGASPEAEADEIHYPGTYLAGGYNRLETELARKVVENQDLVNLPNWLPLTFRIPDEAGFNLMAVEILSHRQELDLKKGILLRTIRLRQVHGDFHPFNIIFEEEDKFWVLDRSRGEYVVAIKGEKILLPLKKLLCPTDFSEPSYQALNVANESALHFSSELFVVHVIAPVPLVPVAPAAPVRR
jgi:hypothetical protein